MPSYRSPAISGRYLDRARRARPPPHPSPHNDDAGSALAPPSLRVSLSPARLPTTHTALVQRRPAAHPLPSFASRIPLAGPVVAPASPSYRTASSPRDGSRLRRPFARHQGEVVHRGSAILVGRYPRAVAAAAAAAVAVGAASGDNDCCVAVKRDERSQEGCIAGRRAAAGGGNAMGRQAGLVPAPPVWPELRQRSASHRRRGRRRRRAASG
eukprot:363088-Chlamydomonas_euryale.AAC.4